MTTVNSVNPSGDNFQQNAKANQSEEKKDASIWNKYDTDNDGKFSKGDKLYKGIEKEISYLEKNGRGQDVSNMLKSILNCVGQTYDKVIEKVQDMYKALYGDDDDYKEISLKFMDKRASMADDPNAFDNY